MNSKISVGYYSDTNSLGGSEVYLKNLLETMDHNKFHLVFYCSNRHPLAAYAQQKGNIKIVFLENHAGNPANNFRKGRSMPASKSNTVSLLSETLKPLWRRFGFDSLKLLAGTIKDIIRLRQVFLQTKVDLLHFNDTGCEPPVIAACLAGVKRIVGTYHVGPSYDKEKTDWVRRSIEWASIRCLDRAISVSQATKQEWMVRTGSNGKNISVIYNGLDLNRFQDPGTERLDQLRRQIGLGREDQVVMVPARLHVMKGHPYLFKGIPTILKAIERVQFLMVGQGPLRGVLEDLGRALKISDHVHFLGFRGDMADLMFLSDLVVLPSVSLESLPYALMEAMACGKPTVATRFSGVPEVVEDGLTGILVPRYDPEALARAIIELVSDKQKARAMGEKGRRRVERLFTQQQMLDRTFEVYQKLLDTK